MQTPELLARCCLYICILQKLNFILTFVNRASEIARQRKNRVEKMIEDQELLNDQIILLQQYTTTFMQQLVLDYFINVLFVKITSNIKMQEDFDSIKIKDGLYLGTLATAQDYDFITKSKISYIVNCSAQIPNYFDNNNIKYLKFKLIKERTHKLWDQNLKKLKKLEKFIEQAQQQALCCMIFSAHGNNRSLVMLCACLMSKYRWSLDKTLAYIRSKDVFIGLSESYITQLEHLQDILNSEPGKPKLTYEWKGPYLSDEEQLISKSYLNSQEIVVAEPEKREKKEKRVTWQDKLDKENKKKKEVRQGRLKQTGIQPFKKVKSNQKFIEEANPCPSVSTKFLRKQLVQSPQRKPQRQKQNIKQNMKQNVKKGKKVKSFCDK